MFDMFTSRNVKKIFKYPLSRPTKYSGGHPRCPTKYSELEGVDSQIYRTFLWSEPDILGGICPRPESMSIDTLGVYCTYVVIFCVQRFEVRQRGGSIPNCWLPVCRVQLADSQIADIWKILLLQVEILVTVTQGITNVPQTNNTSTSGMNEE